MTVNENKKNSENESLRRKIKVLENENSGLRARISNTKSAQSNNAPQAPKLKRLDSPEPRKGQAS